MENWKERLPWIITGAAIIALIIVFNSRDSGSVAAGHPLDLYDDNRERPDNLRRGEGAWDRASPSKPSRLSLHARWRQRRGGV